jgi:hypothetical protein
MESRFQAWNVALARSLQDRRTQMASSDGEKPMIDAQRTEIKRLCHEADIPELG